MIGAAENDRAHLFCQNETWKKNIEKLKNKINFKLQNLWIKNEKHNTKRMIKYYKKVIIELIKKKIILYLEIRK